MSAHAESLFDMGGFRTRLRKQIELNGITARALSRKAGLGNSAARDLLNGEVCDPRISTVMRLAKALNCPPESLLGFQQSKVELPLEHADVLLNIGRDFRRICSITETCLTTEQEEALDELKDECASVRKWRLRQNRDNPTT